MKPHANSHQNQEEHHLYEISAHPLFKVKRTAEPQFCGLFIAAELGFGGTFHLKEGMSGNLRQ